MKLHPSLEKRLETLAKKEWREILRIRDENHFLYLGLLIVITSLLVVVGVGVINQVLKQPALVITLNQPPIGKVLTSSDRAKTMAFEATISNVTESDKPDPAFKIAPSETMLILDIKITNRTAKDQDLVPVNQLYVRGREGEAATMHPTLALTRPLAATTLAPGATVTGQVSFNVPKSLAHPLVYFDPGWGGFGPVVFDSMR